LVVPGKEKKPALIPPEGGGCKRGALQSPRRRLSSRFLFLGEKKGKDTLKKNEKKAWSQIGRKKRGKRLLFPKTRHRRGYKRGGGGRRLVFYLPSTSPAGVSKKKGPIGKIDAH